jgi:small subunit ribosomal protein S2
MPVVSMKALLETGVHFGHRVKRWNPKMKPYIFTERNGVHIIDLQQTIVAIDQAAALIRDIVARGGSVLFIGTKRQAQEVIASQAQRAGQPYITERFLGGTLTNWRTIRSRLDRLAELEAMRDRGELERFTKKEALLMTREIERLNRRMGGIKNAPPARRHLRGGCLPRSKRGQRSQPPGHPGDRHRGYQLQPRRGGLRYPR